MQFTEMNIIVYGPAYLDIVVRVDKPLIADQCHVIDHGGNGIFTPSVFSREKHNIAITDTHGHKLIINEAKNADICGEFQIIDSVLNFSSQNVNATEVIEDLGGMGAGFAKILNAMLISCLPSENCPVRGKVIQLLLENQIQLQPVYLEKTKTDWTLLISSGAFGDKMPIGLRGCHEIVRLDQLHLNNAAADISVVASLPNQIMLGLLKNSSSSIRMLVPSLRNCIPEKSPVSIGQMAQFAEVFAVNRTEWLALGEAAQTAWLGSAAIISISDGPGGADISWRGLDGRREYHHEAAFPRDVKPIDTNRAGEAFAGNFLRALVEMGWKGKASNISEAMIKSASKIASAAAGLTIQIPRFGFPSINEIKMTIQRGIIQ